MENTKLYVLVSFIILIEVQGSGVDITFLESAKAKGAVCLDGSAPAYQFDKGVGAGANNWLVHIQGGGWCTSLKSCHNRTHPSSDMGSSHYMRKSKFSGILSHKKKFNPNFYNWNRILVRYCDGSSFTGDVEEVEPKFGLHFRGARVFDAIVEDLLARGMKNASNALLSGCSAGGLASILHCDKFRALVPTCARVKCVSDAGYFIHVKDISGRYHFEEKYFDRVVKLHGSSKNLPLSCTSKMKDGLCFYPQYAAPHIQTPLFIINSVYDIYQISNILASTANGRNGSWFECQYNFKKCSHSQIRTLQDFRLQFLRALSSGLANSSSRGMFINSCYTHCQSEFRKKWYGDPASKLDKKAIGEAVGDWFYDRTTFQHIDDKHLKPHKCVLNPKEPNPKNNYTWGG